MEVSQSAAAAAAEPLKHYKIMQSNNNNNYKYNKSNNVDVDVNDDSVECSPNLRAREQSRKKREADALVL